jgi:hypothetical protein
MILIKFSIIRLNLGKKASILHFISTYRNNKYAHTNTRTISLMLPTNVFDEIEGLLRLTSDCINYLGAPIKYCQWIDEEFIDLTGFRVI